MRLDRGSIDKHKCRWRNEKKPEEEQEGEDVGHR